MSKSGDARIALVGFPSVGKSYGGAEIQILDLPGIIEGASEGKGRGRQVISAAKVGLPCFLRYGCENSSYRAGFADDY